MSNISRLTWVVVGYLAVAALGMLGILASSPEGAGSPLVTVWFGFCSLSGLAAGSMLRGQEETRGRLDELSNGSMEAKIRKVVGIELAKYATDPKGYAGDVHLWQAAEEKATVLGRKVTG